MKQNWETSLTITVYISQETLLVQNTWKCWIKYLNISLNVQFSKQEKVNNFVFFFVVALNES